MAFVFPLSSCIFTWMRLYASRAAVVRRRCRVRFSSCSAVFYSVSFWIETNKCVHIVFCRHQLDSVQAMTTNSTRKLNSQPNKCHSRECASFTFASWRLIFIWLLCYYCFFSKFSISSRWFVSTMSFFFGSFDRLFWTPLIRCGCECVCVAVFRCLYYRVFDMNFEVWLFIVIILCFVSLELFDDWSFFSLVFGWLFDWTAMYAACVYAK